MGPTASMQGRIAKRGKTANLRGGSHATCVILCSKNLGGGCSAQSLRNSRNATAWVTDPPEPEQLSWEHAEKTKPQHASPSCWLGGEQVPAQPGSLKIGHREILSPSFGSLPSFGSPCSATRDVIALFLQLSSNSAGKSGLTR